MNDEMNNEMNNELKKQIEETLKDYEGNYLSEPGCCESNGSSKSEVNGVCFECGMPTVNGEAAYGCCHSPISCETCGHSSCDGSC